ncbi:hypothetical protein [Streptomyces sp. NPDC093223]|uniref:hypothetical protein n=1 Tax=Streptomyces sp. NPDC093223 TaxID=3366033 RepID=UPI00380A3138
MSEPADEQPKDWMETWFETGDITWQKPLPPAANQRILDLYDELLAEQKRSVGEGAGEVPEV